MSQAHVRALSRLIAAATLNDILLLALVSIWALKSGWLDSLTGVQLALTAFVWIAGYFLVCEIFLGGWTFGRLAMGLAACRVDRAPLSASMRAQRLARRTIGVVNGGLFSGSTLYQDLKLGIVYRSVLLETQSPPAPSSPRRASDLVIEIRTRGSRATFKASEFLRFRQLGVIQVGRDGTWADVKLRNEKVSRKHLLIRRQGDSAILRNLSDKGGTVVNGHRMGPGQSFPCDRPCLVELAGEVTLRIEPI